MHECYVLFCEGSGEVFGLPWWVRMFTGSRWAHVAISDGEVVLNATPDGLLYVPMTAFLENRHDHIEIVRLLTPRQLEFEPEIESELSRMSCAFRVGLSYLTLGIVPSRDCVKQVWLRLLCCGFEVYPAPLCPQDLYDYLIQRGFHAKPARSADFHA